MKRAIAIATIVLALAIPAHAQQTTAPIYCNATVFVDIASDAKGLTQLLTAPMVGNISVCGYSLFTSGTVSAQLGFATASSGGVWTPISPGWAFTTSTTAPLVDSTPNGVMNVPAGDALFLSASTGAQLQAAVRYFETNPGR